MNVPQRKHESEIAVLPSITSPLPSKVKPRRSVCSIHSNSQIIESPPPERKSKFFNELDLFLLNKSNNSKTISDEPESCHSRGKSISDQQKKEEDILRLAKSSVASHGNDVEQIDQVH